MWPWPLTSWPPKLIVSCTCFINHLCWRFALKSDHLFSKYHGNRQMDGRISGQVENRMPPFASLAWWRHENSSLKSTLNMSSYWQLLLYTAQTKATLFQKCSNIVFMNSVMSLNIIIAYLLMALKKVTELLPLWSIETTLNVFDYLLQQASSELNYMPFCLR